MICSKPFSTFADKFVKPSNHEEGLWAILVFFFLKKMKALAWKQWKVDEMRLNNKSESELPQLILSERNKQAEA